MNSNEYRNTVFDKQRIFETWFLDTNFVLQFIDSIIPDRSSCQLNYSTYSTKLLRFRGFVPKLGILLEITYQ